MPSRTGEGVFIGAGVGVVVGVVLEVVVGVVVGVVGWGEEALDVVPILVGDWPPPCPSTPIQT